MAFDPQLIVLGGGVAQAGELLLNAVYLINTAHLSGQIQEIGEGGAVYQSSYWASSHLPATRKSVILWLLFTELLLI